MQLEKKRLVKFNGVGLFKHTFQDTKRIPQFEERVVMTEAESQEDAVNKILSEFREYECDGVKFLGVYEVSEIYPSENNEVVEVQSTMKVFSGNDEEYIEKFWDDQRPMSCDDVGWSHVWFKRSEGISACYNCQEERVGELW